MRQIIDKKTQMIGMSVICKQLLCSCIQRKNAIFVRRGGGDLKKIVNITLSHMALQYFCKYNCWIYFTQNYSIRVSTFNASKQTGSITHLPNCSRCPLQKFLLRPPEHRTVSWRSQHTFNTYPTYTYVSILNLPAPLLPVSTSIASLRSQSLYTFNSYLTL